MLDRKTKNIDASEELLKDRIKITNYVILLVYLVGAGVFIGGFAIYFTTTLIGLPILALMGLFTMMGFFYFASYVDHLQILLHLKQNEKKDVVYIKRKEVKK